MILSSLQPPGAGLPKAELWVARLFLGWQARRATRGSSALRFERERLAILNLVQTADAKENIPRVLIKRPVGLEDSSRYWSVFMTLDHLRIVNHRTGKLIRMLARGETPEKVTGTEDLKPATGVGEQVVAEFQKACDFFQQSIASVTNLRTVLRWPHPWFGPLDAADWHFFTAFHMGLHRHQIEAIRKMQRASQ